MGLCAQDASGNGGSDACQGDSGGPLVSCGEDGNCGTYPGQNYDLIGVVSFGIGCLRRTSPECTPGPPLPLTGSTPTPCLSKPAPEASRGPKDALSLSHWSLNILIHWTQSY